jgi:NADH-quinone oxidoreductase subunit J
MQDVAFIIAAIISAFSGAALVTRKNPVYSVVFMLPFFLAMTTLFVLLQATFLAAIQMIVYGGAILVVFLFVIMLINLKPDELRDDFSLGSYFWSSLGAGLLAAVLALFAHRGTTSEFESAFARDVAPRTHAVAGPATPESKPITTDFGSVENMAYPLFEKQLIPFELASVLIIVATLGAVLLSKKRV